MNLVCDVLDQAMLDRRGQPMGRVDGIVLEISNGAPPRVLSLSIGPIALGQRLHPTLARWVAAVEHAVGISSGRPVEIPIEQVSIVRHDLRADVAIGETAAGAVEELCRRWIVRLPGSR